MSVIGLSEAYPTFLGDAPQPPCGDPKVRNLFIHDGERGIAKRAKEAEAKAVCKPCHLRAACLKWALDTRQAGVWGGTSEMERVKFLRKGWRRG